MKKKNQTSATNRYLLVGLSLFCILMMVFSSFSDKVSGPFKVLANYTVIPLQQGINQIGGWLGDLSDNFETLQQLRTENEKLQEQVDSLVTENSTLQEERYELAVSYTHLQRSLEMEAKSFAVGVRVEHLQNTIDASQ